MVNLTLLAPDIVAAILDDQLPENVSLFDLAADVSAGWGGAEKQIRIACASSPLSLSPLDNTSTFDPERGEPLTEFEFDQTVAW